MLQNSIQPHQYLVILTGDCVKYYSFKAMFSSALCRAIQLLDALSLSRWLFFRFHSWFCVCCIDCFSVTLHIPRTMLLYWFLICFPLFCSSSFFVVTSLLSLLLNLYSSLILNKSRKVCYGTISFPWYHCMIVPSSPASWFARSSLVCQGSFVASYCAPMDPVWFRFGRIFLSFSSISCVDNRCGTPWFSLSFFPLHYCCS